MTKVISYIVDVLYFQPDGSISVPYHDEVIYNMEVIKSDLLINSFADYTSLFVFINRSRFHVCNVSDSVV